MTSLRTIDFNKSPDGLIPAIVQDAATRKVLMLGYMNADAYQKTLSDGVVTFFSRSKNRLWTKGETSGNFMRVVECLVDCDGDTILVKAAPTGPVCHTGDDTCFEEKNVGQASFLNYLQGVLRTRKLNPSADSYTSKLFARGTNKIAQKVGEEAVELVIEAKDSNDALFKDEAADLLFHYLILLEHRNIDLDQIIDVLRQRHK